MERARGVKRLEFKRKIDSLSDNFFKLYQAKIRGGTQKFFGKNVDETFKS